MRRFISLLLVMSLAFTFRAQAQGISDVLKTFRKLEAATEAGMNYGEYARGLSEVNAQLKSFADTSRGKSPAAIEALRSAFELYRKAKTLWDEQRLQDMRYQGGELSLKAYFDGKDANTAEIASVWKQAGQEIDRAATLMNSKQRSK